MLGPAAPRRLDCSLSRGVGQRSKAWLLACLGAWWAGRTGAQACALRHGPQASPRLCAQRVWPGPQDPGNHVSISLKYFLLGVSRVSVLASTRSRSRFLKLPSWIFLAAVRRRGPLHCCPGLHIPVTIVHSSQRLVHSTDLPVICHDRTFHDAQQLIL